MANEQKLGNNYEDQSTDNGFQFEFKCDHCGSGYRSTFKSYALGNVNGLMYTASNLFGGIFSSAASVTNDAKSAKWEEDHDRAFNDAITELTPKFVQCPRCDKWVCRDRCWNKEKGLCKNCAPDLGVEMAAAQASKSVEEVWAHAAMAEEDKKLGTEYWRKGIKATCPGCEKTLEKNVKFCPNCGMDLQAKKECPKCKATITPGSKFCPECGNKFK